MLLCFYIGGQPKSKWFFFIFHWLIWVPVRSTTPFSPAFLHPAFLSLLQRYYTPSYQTLWGSFIRQNSCCKDPEDEKKPQPSPFLGLLLASLSLCANFWGPNAAKKAEITRGSYSGVQDRRKTFHFGKNARLILILLLFFKGTVLLINKKPKDNYSTQEYVSGQKDCDWPLGTWRHWYS